MKSLRQVFGETLIELARANENVLVLDGDLATSTRADLFDDAMPERFLQMGIAEQGMVGTAAGLAALGFIPWLSSFAIFFTHRALDAVRVSVAQAHANVKLGAAYSGLLTGLTGKTHQDVQDLAIMRAMPDMTVLAPADPAECRAMMHWATDYVGPVYVRLARDPESDIFDDTYRFVPGATHLLREGTDVLVISTGTQTVRCLETARLLETAGISAGVLHVPSIKPLDTAAMVNAAASVPLVATVEEHTIYGGLGGLVAEGLSARMPKRVLRIGIQDCWGESATNDALLDKYALSSSRVAERIRAEIQKEVS
jgi:transketolase